MLEHDITKEQHTAHQLSRLNMNKTERKKCFEFLIKCVIHWVRLDGTDFLWLRKMCCVDVFSWKREKFGRFCYPRPRIINWNVSSWFSSFYIADDENVSCSSHGSLCSCGLELLCQRRLRYSCWVPSTVVVDGNDTIWDKMKTYNWKTL